MTIKSIDWINKIKKIIDKAFFITAILVLSAGYIQAATYYVDSGVPDDSGDGSQASPKKYIQSGLDLLNESGGDTLSIANGTYSDANDQITYSNAPSGTSYTTIRAETDWGVTINFPFILGDDHNNTNYIIIRGIRFVAPRNASPGSFYVGHHAKFQKCAFVNASNVDYGALLSIGSRKNPISEYILVEDCYGYGSGGRYKIYTQTCKKVIFRRVVVRADGGWTATASLPSAGLMVYNSEDVLLQNCIAIDSELEIDNWSGAFYTAAKSGSSWPILLGKVTWTGCMAVKVRSIGFHMDLDTDSEDLNLINSIVLAGDSTGYGFFVNQHDGDNTIDYMTVINADRGYRENMSDFTVAITNSIALDSDRENFSGSANFTADYCASWNGGNVDDLQNPITNAYTSDPELNGLVYPVRIEAGSDLKTAGSGGGQIGAEIMKKIGITGTLWGEAGYNTTTDENLWPFPNEDQIQSDMRTEPTIGTRGFCADNQTLTNYIWGYLGNTVPPFRIQVSPGNQKVNLTWNANVDVAGTADADIGYYKVYYGQTQGGPYPHVYSSQGTGYSPLAQITGLTNNTNYHFVVTAVNYGNESAYSDEVTAIPKAQENIPGDLNSDDVVNSQDVDACVNHTLGTENWSEAADVNEDGSVNVLDVQEIVNIILGG